MIFITLFLSLFVTGCLGQECSSELDNNLTTIPVFEVRQELLDQNEDQFPSLSQPEIMKVSDGVYVAIGYDLANTITVETETGIIIGINSKEDVKVIISNNNNQCAHVNKCQDKEFIQT